MADALPISPDIAAYFARHSLPAAASSHFPLLNLPAYDAEQTLRSCEVYHQSDNGHGDDDGVQLGRALALLRPPALTQLYLTRQPALGDPGAAGLAAGLRELTALEVLHVADCGLGDAGGAALADAAKHLGLSRLVLTRNARLGDAGAAALAALLADPAHYVGLKALYLNGCAVGDGGASALAAALPTGARALARLALQDNRIGDPGMLALAAAVDRGGLAQEGEFLYLQNNPCTEAGRAAVARAARGKLRAHLGWPPPNSGIAPTDYD